MKTLIIAKHSKFEWEQIQLGLSEAELTKKLIKEKANIDAILKSHYKQLEARENFQTLIPSDFAFMDDVVNTKDYDLILVLGGDNSFTKVSHYTDNTLILGVNSDPNRSVGCLTRYSVKDAQDVNTLVNKLKTHDYHIEEWTRLKATINGEPIQPSISEYFLGERQRKDMSRHILIHNGKEVEQKCSGLIVSTGSGSTGWYSKAQYDIGRWEPTEKYFGFVATEPYTDTELDYGIVDEGEELIIHSLNDNQGIISADSWEERNFTRGSEAIIRIGKSLRVLIPND